MAKAEKITEDKVITINPYTKNKSYEFGSSGITLSFDANFKYIYKEQEKDIYGYNAQYNSFATRKNNDLILTTLFTKMNGKYKKVTTTIKNFFANPEANYNLKYKTAKMDSAASWSEIITPASSEGIGDLYGGQDIKTTGVNNYLLGTNKSDEFNFANASGLNFVFDQKGNDTYTKNRTTQDQIVDLAGNDKYFHKTSGRMYTYDYSGSDEYNVEANYAKLTTFDSKGNDEYTISNTGAHLKAKDTAGNDKYHFNEGSDFWIDDESGNDKYWVTNNDSTTENADRRINDTKGKDKYYLTGATLDVIDNGGADRYEIKESKNVAVSDYGKGNDTVIISDSSDLEYHKSYIANSSGNENYQLINVSFDSDSFSANYTANINHYVNDMSWAIKDESGKDKYTINDSKYLTVLDEKGNDKYNLNQTTIDPFSLSDVFIYDKEGKDKYMISGYDKDHKAKNITILDRKGNDKYNLKFIDNSDENYYIIDDDGNDNYTVTSCKNMTISEARGKDKYKIVDSEGIYVNDRSQDTNETYYITNSSGTISDDGGNDTYIINKLAPVGESKGITIRDKVYYGAKTGDKDTLIIGANKNDLVFMGNYRLPYMQEDATLYNANDSLIIYDKVNKGFVHILYYYDNSDDGNIETIKAGKTVLKNIPESYSNEILQSVENWFQNKDNWGDDFDCVTDVLSKGSEEQINQLIAYFENR